MLCTKCGQEYEGSQCPRCDGPVILVNNSDYLARRKAYEEKQALKERSASSDKKEESQSDYGQALAKRVQAIKKQSRNKTESKKQSSGKTGNKKQSQNRRKADNRKQNVGKAGGGRNDNQEKPQIRIARRQINKRMKMIAAALIAVLLVGAAAFGIYKLATKKNYALYVSYNGKIYDIAGLDSNYVCDESNAIFAADSKTFYTPQWPEQIDSEKTILSVASDDGKYFVTVTYDESNSSGRYSMYIWNKDECVLVSEDNLQKEIMYISDDGLVIYTNINIINDEGSTNGTSLAMSSIKEVKKHAEAQTTLIEGNLNKAYVYESKHLIVCLTNAGSLDTYDYEKKEKPQQTLRKLIAQGIPADTYLVHPRDVGFIPAGRLEASDLESGMLEEWSDILDAEIIELGSGGYGQEFLLEGIPVNRLRAFDDFLSQYAPRMSALPTEIKM